MKAARLFYQQQKMKKREANNEAKQHGERVAAANGSIGIYGAKRSVLWQLICRLRRENLAARENESGMAEGGIAKAATLVAAMAK